MGFRITAAGKVLLVASAYLLGAAVMLANPVVLAAAALPLLLVAGGASATRAAVEREIDRKTARVGDTVECVLRVTVPAGLHVIEVRQPLPPPFDLVEGSNFRALAGGVRSRVVELRFVFEASKRGEHAIPAPTVRAVDPLGVFEHAPVEVGTATTMEVLPQAVRLEALRDVRARATRPMPEADFARMGVPTTEFREIREYAQGDPLKNVNWKATARRLAAGGHALPLVNEHEFEGKKCAWILIDGGRNLEIGDTVRDAREYAVEVALGLAESFLRRGFAVGASAWRADDPSPLMPATEASQVLRMRARLARLAPAPGPELVDAVAMIRAIALARRPLFVVVTRLDSQDAGTLEGLAALRGLHGERLRGLPALVVDVAPWSLYPDVPGREAALAARRERREAAAKRARATGAIVVEWDPGDRSFALGLAQAGIA